MQFQERIGDGSKDGAAVQVQVTEAHQAGGDSPVDGQFAPHEGAVVRGDTLDAAQQVHGNDGIAGEDIGLVEDTPVDALVPREATGPVDLVHGEAVSHRPVRTDEGDVLIGIDPQVLEVQGGVEVRAEFVLVFHLGLEDEPGLVEAARSEQGVHDVLFREHAGAPAQTLVVEPGGHHELVRPLLVVAQHELGGGAPLPFLVPEPVSGETGQADFPAEFLGGMAADLDPDPFRPIEGDCLFPWAVTDTDIRVLQVSGSKHVAQGGEPFEGSPLFEPLHGGEDGQFIPGERLGTGFLPPGFVLVRMLGHFHFVAARHLFQARERTILERGIPQVAVHLDGNDGNTVVQVGRYVQEHLLVAEEPGPVLPARILAVHGEAPDPVDVGGGGEPAMDGADGEILRIDLHPSFKRRGSDQRPGIEYHGIGLPPVDDETVHERVVIEDMAGGTGRRRDAQVENRQDVPVEVHPERGRAGELPEDILLVQSGNAAGLEDLFVYGGLQGMIPFQDRLGEEDRDVAVEYR